MADPRHHFLLPEEDRTHLDSTGLLWEAVDEGSVRRVVICHWPIPRGYTVETAALYLRIERGYPDAQIDMAYFAPALARCDGKVIGALAPDAFDGKTWQRWSRHRTATNPWRPGVDNIQTHLLFVRHWLERELGK